MVEGAGSSFHLLKCPFGIMMRGGNALAQYIARTTSIMISEPTRRFVTELVSNPHTVEYHRLLLDSSERCRNDVKYHAWLLSTLYDARDPSMEGIDLEEINWLVVSVELKKRLMPVAVS